MSEENQKNQLNIDLLNAAKARNFEEARNLLANGADPRYYDEIGLNAMDYAQLSGNKEFFKDLLIANRKINVRSVIEKLPRLREEVHNIPDLTFQFKWKVYSWMPLVTKFCPNDVWTVWKVGDKVRADSTTADWSGSAWMRGDVSLYIDVNPSDPMDSFILIDNITGERVSLLREMDESDELDMDVDNMMHMDLLKGTIHPECFKIERSKGKKGAPLEPIIHEGKWETIPFDLSNAKMTFLHYYCDYFGKEKQTPVTHSKTYSGQFWCSNTFPVQPNMIKPFLECVTPFPDTAKNILTLLGMFDAGMPLKAAVSVFPTVKFAYEFVNYSDDVDSFRDKPNLPPPKPSTTETN